MIKYIKKAVTYLENKVKTKRAENYLRINDQVIRSSNTKIHLTRCSSDSDNFKIQKVPQNTHNSFYVKKLLCLYDLHYGQNFEEYVHPTLTRPIKLPLMITQQKRIPEQLNWIWFTSDKNPRPYPFYKNINNALAFLEGWDGVLFVADIDSISKEKFSADLKLQVYNFYDYFSSQYPDLCKVIKSFQDTGLYDAATEVARSIILYEMGGIVLNGSVEFLNSPEALHYSTNFYTGYHHTERVIGGGVVAASKGHEILASNIRILRSTLFDSEQLDICIDSCEFTEIIWQITLVMSYYQFSNLEDNIDLILPIQFFAGMRSSKIFFTEHAFHNISIPNLESSSLHFISKHTTSNVGGENGQRLCSKKPCINLKDFQDFPGDTINQDTFNIEDTVYSLSNAFENSQHLCSKRACIDLQIFPEDTINQDTFNIEDTIYSLSHVLITEDL